MGGLANLESCARGAFGTPPALGELVRRVPARKFLSAHVGASEADRNPLPPSDLELDGSPIARRARAINTTAPNPFARLEIGGIVEAFHEAAGVGRDCRFPFGAAPEQSKEHGQSLLNMYLNREQIKYNDKNARDFSGTRQKSFATTIRLELGYKF